MMHYSASRAAHQSITGQSLQSTSALMDAERNNSRDFTFKLGMHKSPKSLRFIATLFYRNLKQLLELFIIHKKRSMRILLNYTEINDNGSACLEQYWGQ